MLCWTTTMFWRWEQRGDLRGRSQPLAGGDVTNLGDDSVTQRPIGLRFFYTHARWKLEQVKEAQGGLFSFLVSSPPGWGRTVSLPFDSGWLQYNCMHLPNTGKVKFAEFPGPLTTKSEHYSADQEEGQWVTNCFSTDLLDAWLHANAASFRH